VGQIISLAILCGGLGIGCSFLNGSGDDTDGDDTDGDDTDGDDTVTPILEIDSFRPALDDMRVDGDLPIIVEFSDPLRASSVSEETFAVSGPFGAVSGGYDIQGETVTFTPAAPFYLLGDYTVTITTELVSEAGGSLAEPFQMSFRVADGEWSGRIDLAEEVGEFLDVARNRRGDMVLPFTTAGPTGSIKAVLFDAAQRNFSLPEQLEQDDQPFGDARAAIDEDGDAVVAWSSAITPGTRGWVRRTDGAWSAPTVEAGAVGQLGLTAGGTAVMATNADPGPATLVETLGPSADAWTAPETAIAGATLAGVLHSGDRVEIVAYDSVSARLEARGFVEGGGGLAGTQHLSPAGVTVDAVNLQYLAGEDLAATWVQNGSQIWHARFDGTSDTWTSDMLASGVLGSAVCANDEGERLAAYISGGSIYAAHADPGHGFSEPQELGSPAGMEYARCTIDQLGNGVLIWARAGGKSLRARYAGGVFSDAAELGDGPSVIEALAEQATGHARVIFYNGEKLTALAFE
jgi:hypothetical protein